MVGALQELTMQTAVVIDLGEGERGDCASLLSILHHCPHSFLNKLDFCLQGSKLMTFARLIVFPAHENTGVSLSRF